MVAEEFKPEQKTEEDEKWLSRRVDGDVDLEDVDDLSSWIRTKMKERNEQIEQEDEETKKAKLAERKRKVLSYQEQQKILLKELSDMKKKSVGEGDFCYFIHFTIVLKLKLIIIISFISDIWLIIFLYFSNFVCMNPKYESL